MRREWADVRNGDEDRTDEEEYSYSLQNERNLAEAQSDDDDDGEEYRRKRAVDEDEIDVVDAGIAKDDVGDVIARAGARVRVCSRIEDRDESKGEDDEPSEGGK